ncbi:hypothetical protein HDU93_005081, partial [Gonapodya sp. JEL0774]
MDALSHSFSTSSSAAAANSISTESTTDVDNADLARKFALASDVLRRLLEDPDILAKVRASPLGMSLGFPVFAGAAGAGGQGGAGVTGNPGGAGAEQSALSTPFGLGFGLGLGVGVGFVPQQQD